MTKKASDIKNHYYTKVGDYETMYQETGTGLLGSWSKEDEATFNKRMADADWQNQLALVDYENWYNSPEQQAIRMREAGLNPDLQGVQNQPSASASSTKPTAPSGTNDFDTAITMANAFIGTISMAHKLTTGVMQAFGQNLANHQATAEAAFNGASRFLQNIAPAGVAVIGPDGKMTEATHQLLDSASLKAFEGMFPRGKARKYARSFLESFQDSEYHKQLWYALRGTTEDKRQKLLSWLGSSPYSSLDSVLMEGMGEVYTAIHKANLNEANFKGSYFGTLDGTKKGNAENFGYSRMSNFNNLRQEAVKAFDDTINKLTWKREGLYNIVKSLGPVLIDYFLGQVFANYKK